MARIPLIVGNWKMNGTLGETLKLITELRHKLPMSTAEVVVAPPFTTIYSAYVVLQETPIKLAAQNGHWESDGAFTGEISMPFLKDIGCSYVILGHSERRQMFGETDEKVSKKVFAALTNELSPIVCVGETEAERKAGRTDAVLEGQIKRCLSGVPMTEWAHVVVAYEPVWAIGTGRTPSPQDIESAIQGIRNWIANKDLRSIEAMETFLTVIHYVVCAFLIIVILLQAGKGADIGAAFGAGGSQTLFGPRGAATFLNKLTAFVAIAFLMTSLGLVVISKHRTAGSVLEKIPASETVPAAPLTMPETQK